MNKCIIKLRKSDVSLLLQIDGYFCISIEKQYMIIIDNITSKIGIKVKKGDSSYNGYSGVVE